MLLRLAAFTDVRSPSSEIMKLLSFDVGPFQLLELNCRRLGLRLTLCLGRDGAKASQNQNGAVR